VNAPIDIAGIIETSFQLATTFLPGRKNFCDAARPGREREAEKAFFVCSGGVGLIA
jgi:hypothetical protein